MTESFNQRDNENKDKKLSDSSVQWSNYVSLKGKKLTQAVYLVTSIMPDGEPLKWRLRDLALDILSDISVLQPTNLSADDLSERHQISPLFKSTVLESAIIKIDQIISWIEVSLAGNFESDLNLNLLRQEYLSFNNLLKERIQVSSLNKLVETSNLGLLENHQPAPKVNVVVSDKANKDNIGQPTQGQVSYQKISHLPHKNRDVAKDSRRALIISFLKGKDWTSIKDISDAIGGCSSKTIQRELADLVHQGVLKKKGDRRWSRYLLA